MSEISLRELRKYVFDSFVESARAPLVEQIMQRFQLSREVVVERLQDLQASHHILLLPGTYRILMANPFSNIPSPFRVSTGSMQYYANCAWDAVAFHVMLDRDVRISSFCHHCGTPIEFSLSRRKLGSNEGKDVIVFLGTPVSKWYDNLVVTCSNTMVFFASRDHLNEWQKGPAGPGGEAYSIEKMIEIVGPISQGRATLDYRMPSKDELMAHWDSLGLRGAFWKF